MTPKQSRSDASFFLGGKGQGDGESEKEKNLECLFRLPSSSSCQTWEEDAEGGRTVTRKRESE